MTHEPKPSGVREWVIRLKTLIINDGIGLPDWVRQDREDEIHVIEKSAYDEVVSEKEELKKQLDLLDEFRVMHTILGYDLKSADQLRAEREQMRAERDKLLAQNAELVKALEKITKAQGHSDKIICLATIDQCVHIAKAALDKVRGEK